MSKKAYIFPGQGAQFVGMGKDLYDQYEIARTLFNQANTILGFNITRSAIPTSNNATPRSGDTTPCPHVTLSPRGLRSRFPLRPSAAHPFALLLVPPRGVLRSLTPPYRDHRQRQGT